MPRLLPLIVIAAAIAVFGVLPSTAAAGGCPSNQTVMTSSSNSSYVKSGYICAQEDHSGDLSIGAGKTHSWNKSTNADYFPWYYCYDTSTSAITVSHAQTWGSVSYTATNSLTAPNTRDWAVGVLWTLENVTPSGFSKGCTYKGSATWSHPPAILNISSVSYSGFPASAVAGQSYPISVTVSPSSATGSVYVEDHGVGVASGVLSGGKATINWIPAVDGTSKVVVAYAGDSSNTPAEKPNTNSGSSPLSIPVSGGVGVAITAASSAGATVTVTPATQTGTLKLIDATSKTLRGVAALSGTGTTSLPFAYAANTSYNLVAIVSNSAGANVGQSYPYAWKSNGVSPASKTSTVAVSGVPTGGAKAGSTYPLTATVTPSTATGTVVLQDGGQAIATAPVTNGSASLNWTPAVDGTSRLTVLYSGDAVNPFAATAPSSSCAATSSAPAATYCVAVTGGTGLAISAISAANATTGSATVAVTPSTWSGTVLLIDTSTQKPIGSGIAANGSAAISFPYAAGTSYTLVAKITSSSTPGQSYPVTWSSTAGLSRRMQSAARLPAIAVPTPGAQARFGEILETMDHVEGGGADPALQLRTVTRTTSGKTPFNVKCPAGSRVLNADAMTSGPVDEIEVASYTKTGVRIAPSPADRGHRVIGQLLCRPAGARAIVDGQVAYGTILPNEIRLTGDLTTAFGGPGRDLLTTDVEGSALWGGLGSDIMIADGDGSTAAGGPGADSIIAGGTSAHLLVGGIGRDTVTSSFGPDLINVRDGHGGDIVTCRNARVRVMADTGDAVSGPCLQVDTTNGAGLVFNGKQ